MVKEIFVDLSLSSTRRCQLGKDFRYSRAPMAELRTIWLTPAFTQASIMFHSSSMSWEIGKCRPELLSNHIHPRQAGLEAFLLAVLEKAVARGDSSMGRRWVHPGSFG